MNGYPVLLKVENRRCVVVGGGQVATRKVTTLLDAGAHICLISPVVDPTLQQLSDVGRIEIRHMAYRPDHLTEIKPFLAIAATDNPVVNQQVAADATQMNILVNVVDAPSHSDFTNMAIIQRGPIVIGIASGGTSAALSAYLKAQIEPILGPEIERLAGWMGETRVGIQANNLNQPERAAVWQKVLDSPILDLLRQGDSTSAKKLFDELLAEGMR